MLNPLLQKAKAVPLLARKQDGETTLRVGVGLHGVAALEARLPAALAGFVAEHGTQRLGVCGSDPCRCVFVDRTRAGTRKYCCSYCNDRFAARAYRRRKKLGSPMRGSPTVVTTMEEAIRRKHPRS